MIRVLIIEDEQPAVEKLSMLLDNCPHKIDVLYSYPSVKESISWLKANKPDLIFCDIHLSDGNAFSIFEEVTIDVPIIFTTAYDKYAIKAFEQKSIGYLLKPFDEHALNKSIEKYLDWNKPTTIDLEGLRKVVFGKEKEYKQRFLINIGRKYETIIVKDVAYFFNSKGQTYLRTHTKKDYPIDDSLIKLSEILDPVLFFHVNRNFIVGLKSIDLMYKASPRRVILKLNPSSDQDLAVPEEKFSALKKWLDR